MRPTRRAVVAVLAAVQLALAGTAWVDLVRRPARLVRGPKWIWALVIAVNVVGPLWYYRWGRIPAPIDDAAAPGPGARTPAATSAGSHPEGLPAPGGTPPSVTATTPE